MKAGTILLATSLLIACATPALSQRSASAAPRRVTPPSVAVPTKVSAVKTPTASSATRIEREHTGVVLPTVEKRKASSAARASTGSTARPNGRASVLAALPPIRVPPKRASRAP